MLVRSRFRRDRVESTAVNAINASRHVNPSQSVFTGVDKRVLPGFEIDGTAGVTNLLKYMQGYGHRTGIAKGEGRGTRLRLPESLDKTLDPSARIQPDADSKELLRSDRKVRFVERNP
jgi:hypothetical protein